MAASPDGNQVAVGTPNGLAIWNVETGQQGTSLVPEIKTSAYFMDWSSDGRQLAWWTGTEEKRIHFCDVSMGELTKTYEAVSYPRLSPDLRLVAVPHGRSARRLWESENGDTLCILLGLKKGRGIAISPEGHYRASTRADREIVYVVQTADGQETLSTNEFSENYGWQNDPSHVGLDMD